MSVTFILYLIFTLALIWLYGKIRYAEGERHGSGKGMVIGTCAFFHILKFKKTLGQDNSGNVFRLNDKGDLAETVVSCSESPDLCAMLKNLTSIENNKHFYVDSDDFMV